MADSHIYDAVVVGSGPNGLAAGIRLALEGLEVKIFEAEDTVGGGMRTRDLMQPGVIHDICSAIHPMAAASPFLSRLPLEEFGVEWITPEFPVAHPLDDEPAVIMQHDIRKTADELNGDSEMYRSILEPVVNNFSDLTNDFLGPLTIPDHPIKLARFGLQAIKSAERFQRQFQTPRAKALFAGLAAHSILPLSATSSAAIGIVLGAAGHKVGWPLPKGGSQSIADSMAAYFESLGGVIETGQKIESLKQLPPHRCCLFDLTPRQVLQIVGDEFPKYYKKRLEKFRYGQGVFKIDYILSEPVPWSDPRCNRAGTVHLGGTYEEIAESEKQMSSGKHSDKPYVLVAQQSLFDETRTPDSRHTLWAYCHVPHGSERDMTLQIENQIERFAPGFRDIVEERHTMNTAQFEEYNANYFGGDINGGSQDIWQLFTRPVHLINPYATPAEGIYICSSSTPPGGGVHGMCGYHAAMLALRKEFGRSKKRMKFGND
ncbi:NAD(P)/FAD-dependent oxidoreductase [Rhodohalobacter sp. SW132]|uniref:phytoene desaturase family protein n=1 Tax=Rhodohalobacter sp. SW132 TaxID=2293433 RepID=UPI000E2690D9|nr:NAD(P)/FAD-dependent oxidoreductase [Rhodohalobacter sp. SW132]REL24326.1 NAD(P)/FAD-dependent oxidoreductase [Rhodohalobacter sp. SW132]